MKRKWFEEKAETVDGELQKRTTPEYKRRYDHIFKGAASKIKELVTPQDVREQENFRSGWDNIWSKKDD